MLWDKGIYTHSDIQNFKTKSAYKTIIDEKEFTIEERNLNSKGYSFLSWSWFKNIFGRIGTNYFAILDKEKEKATDHSSFVKTNIDGRSLYIVFTSRNLRKGFFDSFKEKFGLHFDTKTIVLIVIGIAIVVGLILSLRGAHII